MIVKVQVSLATSHRQKRVLIYNEDRSVQWEGALTEEIAMITLGRPKSYFEAILHKDGKLEFMEKVEDQDW